MRRAISIFYSYFCYGRRFDANNGNPNENNYSQNNDRVGCPFRHERRRWTIACEWCNIGQWVWFFRYSSAIRISNNTYICICIMRCEITCGTKSETASIGICFSRGFCVVLTFSAARSLAASTIVINALTDRSHREFEFVAEWCGNHRHTIANNNKIVIVRIYSIGKCVFSVLRTTLDR